MGVEFETQVKMEGMRYKYPLKFDFFLRDQKTAIEFNGIQHYEPIEAFDGSDGFQLTSERDVAKREWCKENGIALIELPYWLSEQEIESQVHCVFLPFA